MPRGLARRLQYAAGFFLSLGLIGGLAVIALDKSEGRKWKYEEVQAASLFLGVCGSIAGFVLGGAGLVIQVGDQSRIGASLPARPLSNPCYAPLESTQTPRRLSDGDITVAAVSASLVTIAFFAFIGLAGVSGFLWLLWYVFMVP